MARELHDRLAQRRAEGAGDAAVGEQLERADREPAVAPAGGRSVEARRRVGEHVLDQRHHRHAERAARRGLPLAVERLHRRRHGGVADVGDAGGQHALLVAHWRRRTSRRGRWPASALRAAASACAEAALVDAAVELRRRRAAAPAAGRIGGARPSRPARAQAERVEHALVVGEVDQQHRVARRDAIELEPGRRAALGELVLVVADQHDPLRPRACARPCGATTASMSLERPQRRAARPRGSWRRWRRSRGGGGRR